MLIIFLLLTINPSSSSVLQRRFLFKDPSSSSSSVHFQVPKNLQSFKNFRPKIEKIFWENLTIFWTKLSEKVQKYILFLKLWTSIFPQHNVKFYCWENLSKLLPERKFLTTIIFHFPLKIFVSLKIFKEIAIFEEFLK